MAITRTLLFNVANSPAALPSDWPNLDWSGKTFTNILTVEAGTATGSSGTVGIWNTSAKIGRIQSTNLTANRGYQLPDQSGTFLLSGGPITGAYVAKTANYTTTATDGTVNCTTGSFTITLLTAVGHTGLTQVVKNSGAGTILVNTTSSQTIDGSLTQSLSAKQSITVQSDGANWILI